MKLINLTGTDLLIQMHDERNARELARSDEHHAFARFHYTPMRLINVDGWGLCNLSWAHPSVNLPPAHPSTMYIVSRPLEALVPEREDVVSPGRILKKDKYGKPVLYEGLVKSWSGV